MRYILNQKVIVLNFIVLSLFFGIVMTGYADDTETPHFHDETTTLTVEENADSNVNIGAPFTAHNVGENDEYRLSGTDADNFNLHPATGQLKTSAWLDYETKTSYSVTVEIHQASNEMVSAELNGVTVSTYNYTLRDSIAVTINVTNLDYEFLPGENVRSVAENLPVGTNVGSQIAHEFGSNTNYTFVLGGTDASSFKLRRLTIPNEPIANLFTNQIQTNAALDYETKNSYEVTLKLQTYTEKIIPTGAVKRIFTDRDTITVSINVTDANDAPVFANATATRSIAENTVADTDIGAAFTATDQDENTLTYSLGGTDASSFAIGSTTGQLKTKVPLDYETKATYMVNVIASDADDSDSISVTINVTDVDENTTSSVMPSEVDAPPSITSDEIAQIISLLSMDKVIFNELYNASNDTHDWLELRNISDIEVNLSGWQMKVNTGLGREIISFPDGTLLSSGEVLLLVNTAPNSPESQLSDPGDGTVRYVVDANFDLPQTDFALILQGLDGGYEDSVGNYFPNREIKPATALLLTANVAWTRAKPAVIGYQAEAWVESGYRDGLGYDEGAPESTSLGTPGHRLILSTDLDGNGVINILDLVLVASKFGATNAPEADLNADGVVNIRDLEIVANSF